MIRKFSLTNSKDEIISLGGLNAFAHDPEGLGVSFTNEYIGADADFILSKTAPNQGVMSVSMLFGALDEKYYQDFRSFAEFLNYQPLEMTYETDAGKYSRGCRLRELTKTEVKDPNVIDETMTLEFLTPWYQIYSPSQYYDDDPAKDGKTYAQAMDDPPTETNLFPDPVITDFTSGNWLRGGSDYIWDVESDEQFVQGDNILIIDHNLANQLSVPANSRILTADNLDTDGQTVDKTILLKFFFKADYTDLTTPDLVVSALDSSGEIIPAFKMVDAFGQILPDGNVSYNLNTNYAGMFLEFNVAYKITSETTKIAKFNFLFTETDSEYCYFTAPQLLQMDETSVEDTDAYYIYDYVYEEAEDHTAPNYFEFDNDSEYFGTGQSSPLKVFISAGSNAVENPSWNLFVGSQIVQSDRYLLTIPSGYTLEVSSYPEDKYARLYAPDGSYTNVYQQQDLTKTNFVKLPPGASTLVFSVGDAKIDLEARFEKLLV
jgi:hypothetical protein